MEIGPAAFPRERDAVQALFREYERYLGIDLCFQSFAEEVERLPGRYAPPGGNIVLARDGGALLGCVAWYRFAPAIAELKRLYVRESARGRGLGRALLEQAIAGIRAQGYAQLYLDSLEHLTEATALYRQFGFTRIPSYNASPLPGVYHMALDLAPAMQHTEIKHVFSS